MIAGNWKMHMTAQEAMELVSGILKQTTDVNTDDVDILVAPPFTALSSVSGLLSNSPVLLAGQNMHWEEKGAFTGEISPLMLKEVGCSHVIIGHSERRQLFGETNETVNKKLHAAFAHGLTPILCVGESLEEREANQTFSIIEEELKGGLNGLTTGQVQSMILAYEPIWAIGTGKTASPEQAEEVHAFIRNWLESWGGSRTSEKIRILYGGSVKPENVEGLMVMKNIDGGLVGGASLKANSFSQIIKRGL
jgi:triosephosphate isomerase